jgi:hypothetical protein
VSATDVEDRPFPTPEAEVRARARWLRSLPERERETLADRPLAQVEAQFAVWAARGRRERPAR